MNREAELRRPPRVACSDLLDGWCMAKSCDDSARPSLRDVDNVGNQLAIMARHKSGVTFTVESLKDKSVWLDISDLSNADAECVNENVVILRGRLGKLLYRLLQCRKSSVTTHQAAHNLGLPLASHDCWIGLDGNLSDMVEIVHNVKPSNAPAHRRRADDVRLSTETQSRRSVQPVCSAICMSFSFQASHILPSAHGVSFGAPSLSSVGFLKLDAESERRGVTQFNPGTEVAMKPRSLHRSNCLKHP